jgi:hypothetical protein
MQGLRQLWQRNIGGKVLIGCGGLIGVLFACAICSVIVAAITPKGKTTTAAGGSLAVASTPSATVSPTISDLASTVGGDSVTPTDRPEVRTALALATQIARPTQTPEPTPTTIAAPPTIPPTPEPTGTSVPTTTPQPPTEIPSTPTTDVVAQNQADVRAYFDKVGPIVARLGPALGEVGRLAGEVGDKPALLFDQDWKIELASQMAIVQSSNTAVLAVQPVPGPAQEFHGLLTKATQTCSDSMDTLAKGLDTLNATTIERASAQMTDCNVKTRIATAKMPQLP